jgi:hypothetical protein
LENELAIQKIEQVHEDKQRQQVQVDLAQELLGHRLVPLLALGRIRLIQLIVFELHLLSPRIGIGMAGDSLFVDFSHGVGDGDGDDRCEGDR